MAYEGGRSMDVPKKNRPNTKKKIAARREARKESGLTAQQYYVRTRMAEAAKSGKTLDRAALRKKFQSGDVARKGFGAPKKKTSSSSSTSSSGTLYKSTDDAAGRTGYRAPTSNKSSLRDDASGRMGYRAPGRSVATKKKSGNSFGRFIANELLGVDDFKRVGKYVKSGQYGKAAKSLGAGAFELGTSALTVTGVGAAAKGAQAAAKASAVAARAAKASKTAKAAASASRASKATKAKAVTKAAKASKTAKVSRAASKTAATAKSTARGRVVLKGTQIGTAKAFD